MRLYVLGYDPVKLPFYHPIPLIIRKLAGHSWSRPSTDSMRWGFKGINDGEADTQRITPDRF